MHNGMGDVIGLLNSGGNTVADYRFDAFGNQLGTDGNWLRHPQHPAGVNAIHNPFRYRGDGYFDGHTGFIYQRFRYLDTTIGRFINEDPIRWGLNWYCFAMQNPIMFFDFWGLAPNFIFHGTDRVPAANATRQQLINSGIPEYDITMIEVATANDFIVGWSAMGEDGTPIENIFIHLHGEVDFIHGGDGSRIFVSDLDVQTMDTIFLSSCDVGNMNYIGSNVASQLAMRMNVNQVIAPDGLGYFFSHVGGIVSSFYFPDSGIYRQGNGFTLYQNIGGQLIVTPGLTVDREGHHTLTVFRRGVIAGQMNHGFVNWFGVAPESASHVTQHLLNTLINQINL